MKFFLKIVLKSGKSAKSASKLFDIYRGFSTNSPFYAKRTQFFPVFSPKTTFLQKNEPKRTQTEPYFTCTDGLLIYGYTSC